MDDDFHPSDLLDDTVLGSAGGSRMAALKVRKYLIFLQRAYNSSYNSPFK